MTLLTNEIGVVEAVAASPSDTVDTVFVTNSLWCTASGNVVVTLTGMNDGDTITYAIVAGERYPLRVKRVFSTLTTATVFIER